MKPKWTPVNPYSKQFKNRTPANGWDIGLQMDAFDRGAKIGICTFIDKLLDYDNNNFGTGSDRILLIKIKKQLEVV